MKKNNSYVLIVFVCLLHLSISCQNIKKEGTKVTSKNEPQSFQSFDSLAIAPFFKKHPAFQKYENEVVTLYQQQEYNDQQQKNNGQQIILITILITTSYLLTSALLNFPSQSRCQPFILAADAYRRRRKLILDLP